MIYNNLSVNQRFKLFSGLYFSKTLEMGRFQNNCYSQRLFWYLSFILNSRYKVAYLNTNDFKVDYWSPLHHTYTRPWIKIGLQLWWFFWPWFSCCALCFNYNISWIFTPFSSWNEMYYKVLGQYSNTKSKQCQRNLFVKRMF